MKRSLFTTENNWAGLIARVTLGSILWPHGAQKLLGLFNGFGFSGTMQFFTGSVHMPWVLGLLVILIEFFGALLLILGFGGRVWSALIFILMIGVMFTSHIDNGFFMNWFNSKKGEGFEFDLLAAGLALTVLINGSGKWSVDRKISLK